MSSQVSFETDDRNPPDADRRGRFGAGWRDAVSGKGYAAKTLETLTWQNLGYRMGSVFGGTSPEMVDELFDWCARHYKEYGQLK